MKENIMKRTTLFLVVLLLVTTCIISATYAKYASTDVVTAGTNIAKWSFKVENVDISKTQTFNFDLFNTINYTDTGNETPHLTQRNMIAPGTKGSFVVDLNNTSDVEAMCEFSLSTDYSNLPNGVTKIPLEFSFDGSTYSASPTYTETPITSGATKQVTVYWRWPASGYSDTDKLLQGTNANATVTLKAVASQTRP